MHDSEVAAAIVAGDPDGLAEAYDRYAAPLYTYCRSLLREPADAADAVQDTFVIAASKLAGLRDPSRLRPWLYAVARNEPAHRAVPGVHRAQAPRTRPGAAARPGPVAHRRHAARTAHAGAQAGQQRRPRRGGAPGQRGEAGRHVRTRRFPQATGPAEIGVVAGSYGAGRRGGGRRGGGRGAGHPGGDRRVRHAPWPAERAEPRHVVGQRRPGLVRRHGLREPARRRLAAPAARAAPGSPGGPGSSANATANGAPGVSPSAAAGGTTPAGGGPSPSAQPSSHGPSPSHSPSPSRAPSPSASSTTAPPPPPPPGTLRVAPRTIVVSALSGASLTLTASGGPVSWSVTESSGLIGQLSVAPSSGRLLAGQSTTVSVNVTGGLLGLASRLFPGPAAGCAWAASSPSTRAASWSRSSSRSTSPRVRRRRARNRRVLR